MNDIGANTTIVVGFPPNIARIKEVFTLRGGEIFAWGGIIYSPSTPVVPVQLIAHEEVHFKQQRGDPRLWWDHYLADPNFRLRQELEAHQMEYRVFCKSTLDRNRRARYLNTVARRLSGPLYNNLITMAKAMKLIKTGGSL